MKCKKLGLKMNRGLTLPRIPIIVNIEALIVLLIAAISTLRITVKVKLY